MKSRRNFLKVAGAGVTASLLSAFSSSVKLRSGPNPIKIGVLLPQSNEHPQYPGSFLSGLRLGINQNKAFQKNHIEISTEQVNFGSAFRVKEKIQQLVSENKVNLVVALINSEIGVDIDQLTRNTKLPVLICNAGESYPVKQVKENPYLFFNSLNLFQCAYMSGEYAVKEYGKNIAIVSSLYDSGYDAMFAFYKGVESAGGNDVKTYLEKQKDKDFTANTIEEIKSNKFDALYVYLNGNKADDFFRQLHMNKIDIPVLTTAFATENHRLPHLGEAATNIQYFGAWNINLPGKENQHFVNKFKTTTNKEPDQFAFLGYESGEMLYSAIRKCAGDYSGSTISHRLSNTKINASGGQIQVTKNSGLVNNPIYLNKIQKAVFNQPESRSIRTFQPISEFDPVFNEIDNNLRSGWINPYLFV